MVVNGEDESIKEILYGISDYELIRAENYYYVDKTPYLKKPADTYFLSGCAGLENLCLSP